VTCPLVPQDGCVAWADSRLSIRNDGADNRSFKWRLSRGPAMQASDFGSPASTTSYELCLYDAGDLAGHASLRAGDTCGEGGTDRCWDPTSRGFRYRDSASSHDGITRVALDAGEEGRSKISVQGEGALLAVPPLPLANDAMPLTVQLLASHGRCWQAVHEEARRNTAQSLSARTP
jgi:hypothetical protein